VNGDGLEGPRSNEAEASSEPPVARAHWALDDGSGTSAVDSSGNGYTGALVNGPVWVPGLIDGGLHFDGSNDRVNLPPAAMNGLSDVTLTLWLRTTKTGQQSLISAANSGNDNEVLVFLRSSTTVDFYTGQTAGGLVTWTVPSLADDEWHHLTIVRNDLADTVSLYVDGALVGTHATSLQAISVAANGFVIGQEQDSVGGGFQSSQAFSGSLDDVRIYSRALTSSEVAALVAALE
jgi:hypothetical protein